ncbi:MAG TPA: hypothetical protein P5287_08240 [bacterium]|nr:hypothetical protein [bacterium]
MVRRLSVMLFALMALACFAAPCARALEGHEAALKDEGFKEDQEFTMGQTKGGTDENKEVGLVPLGQKSKSYSSKPMKYKKVHRSTKKSGAKKKYHMKKDRNKSK